MILPLYWQPRNCISSASQRGLAGRDAPSHSFCRCTRFWRGTGNLTFFEILKWIPIGAAEG